MRAGLPPGPWGKLFPGIDASVCLRGATDQQFMGRGRSDKVVPCPSLMTSPSVLPSSSPLWAEVGCGYQREARALSRPPLHPLSPSWEPRGPAQGGWQGHLGESYWGLGGSGEILCTEGHSQGH